MKNYIAHIRTTDKTEQTLQEHLISVSNLCAKFASSANLKTCGALLGMLHDLGKYSNAFQEYIRSSVEAESLEADDEDATPIKRVDHSTSGSQFLFNMWNQSSRLSKKPVPEFVDILAIVLLSHHNPAGLIDFVDMLGEKERFANRISKNHLETFIEEVKDKKKISEKNFIKALKEIGAISKSIKNLCLGNDERLIQHSILAKFLYSCLIDADRTDSADFENPHNKKSRNIRNKTNWKLLHQTFEDNYQKEFGNDKTEDPIKLVRGQISEACFNKAQCEPGIYRLPVPTGGGKTLSSLRFASRHAALRDGTDHPVEHIIYILPYTSILIQNADEARKFLGQDNVLEHHSNLLSSQITRKQLLFSENWDAPVIFTTSVQFMNAFFSNSKEAQRRMHQLASSVIIFDEVQALPTKAIHLFNNAVNFLTRHTHSTALMCTATQPLLDEVSKDYGCLRFMPEDNLTEGIDFGKLSARTRLIDKRKFKVPYTYVELCKEIAIPLKMKQHVLMVVNTKIQAQNLYDAAKAMFHNVEIVHLSNSQCPSHVRKMISTLDLENRRINNGKTLLCIATSLVEAGVDLDFDLVVRDFGSFISIVQAAGRGNRHGKRGLADMWIVNLEAPTRRPGLKEEMTASDRVLREMMRMGIFDGTMVLNYENVNIAVKLYFHYFYHENCGEDQMLYPVKEPYRTNLIELLSNNGHARDEVIRGRPLSKYTRIFSAFESASKLFAFIDTGSRGVIVPYLKEGEELINDLCSSYLDDQCKILGLAKMIGKARRYTVNLFDSDWKKLADRQAIHEVQAGTGVFYLDKRYYHPDKGIVIDPIEMDIIEI
jgi:CRISPR-associated endonuclease/helicase Cas3